MSTLQKLFSATLAIALLFGVGLFTTQAQTNAGSFNINTASTAELQSILLDLQQRVNDLTRQINAQSRSQDQGEDSQENSASDAVDDTPANNFELSAVLSQGSQGQEVRRVQQLLAQRPDIYPEGLVTGYYGRLTARAVSRLQRQAGLPAVGRMGQQTFNYLQRISKEIDQGDQEQRDDREQVTLYDEYEGYEFTATLTQVADNTWQYEVEGTLPSPNYDFDVSVDGSQLVGLVTPLPSAAPQPAGGTDVSASGQLTLDGATGAEEGMSFDVREAASSGDADADGDGKENEDNSDGAQEASSESITLTDTFLDTYEFTATVTRADDNRWRYVVRGSTPSPNYDLTVVTDGPAITAQVKQNTGAAPTVVSEVEASGSFSIDSITEAEEISFEVRNMDASSEGKASSDSGTAEQTESHTQGGMQVRY